MDPETGRGERLTEGQFDVFPALSPDGSSITDLRTHEGADELWSLPAQGGEPRRVIRFEGKEIADFAWSPEGTRLAVVKVARSGDVVLLRRTPS